MRLFNNILVTSLDGASARANEQHFHSVGKNLELDVPVGQDTFPGRSNRAKSLVASLAQTGSLANLRMRLHDCAFLSSASRRRFNQTGYPKHQPRGG